MEENLKQLLLKDLCARLPYGVKVKHEAQDFPSTLLWVDSERLSAGRKADKIGVGSDWGNIEYIKPYLRPLSSMTEDEKIEWDAEYTYNSKSYEYEEYLSKMIDWLNAHHFDYRNLIERGLAIDCTNLNVY